MAKLFQIPILLLVVLSSCVTVRQNRTAPNILLKVDTDFSKLAKEKGMGTAFLQYIDDSAVLLKPDQYPIVGTAAKQFYQDQGNDTGLTWKPNAAFIARSGELGYNYGIWTLAAKDTTLQGTYVTIWRKQRDGSWKFVLDTGQSGLGKN